jgi:hypothetical protein
MAPFPKINVEDFTKKTTILVLLDIFFLILPGTACIYLLKPDLFISIDWIKLILLSASITAPFVLLNLLIVSVGEEDQNNDDKRTGSLFEVFTLATFLTGASIYILLGLFCLSGYPVKNVLIFGLCLEAVFLMNRLLMSRKKKNV